MNKKNRDRQDHENINITIIQTFIINMFNKDLICFGKILLGKIIILINKTRVDNLKKGYG